MTRIQLCGIYHWNITQDIASISLFKLDFVMTTTVRSSLSRYQYNYIL